MTEKLRHPPPPSREEQANLEVGHTTITRPQIIFLVVMFLAVIIAVPLIQHISELRTGATPQAYDILRAGPPTAYAYHNTNGPVWSKVWAANNELVRHIESYEDALEDASWLSRAARRPVQQTLTGLLHAGNEKVYTGRDGWLFYRPDIDMLTGAPFLDPRQLTRRAASSSEWSAPPQPDPRPAILSFHQQLKDRGITLIIVPAPAKPTIHPEKFAPALAAPLHNPSWPILRQQLEKSGVLIFDPADTLVAAARSTRQPQYLATDTHWTPAAMDAVAADLAAFLRTHVPDLPAPDRTRFSQRDINITNTGDIAAMLDLPQGSTLFPPQTVTIQPVQLDQRPWARDPAAPLLLLGDSFTNIYSFDALNWGQHAGLAERLSFHLATPLDVLARNDAGSHATRADLARNPARLAHKRVVIWQFAARELAHGDWQAIDLRPATPTTTSQPAPVTLIITGQVAARSAVPRPDSVPYADHIMALHITNAQGLPAGATDLVCYTTSMKARTLTSAARLQPGDKVRIKLQPWSAVAPTLGRINRSELDDPELQLRDHYWAELLTE